MKKILKNVFGHNEFRPLQKEAITCLLERRDAMVLMPTGAGKSLCYQLPALMCEGVCIVISPLIALMQDQVDSLRAKGVRAEFLNSTLDDENYRAVMQKILSGDVQLLYVSPERMMLPSFLQLAERIRVSFFAIDEAHCVSQWGHDFRPEYKRLSALKTWFPDTPIIALTATADPRTREEICSELLREPKVFAASFNRPNLTYTVVWKKDAKEQLLAFILLNHRKDSGIVYCLSRKSTEEVAEFLWENGIKCAAYHAGLPDSERQAVQRDFLEGKIPVIVATVAFGMGIDKENVRFVAHYDLPKSLENFFQESGRAGRDGRPADCWVCAGFRDAKIMESLISKSSGPVWFRNQSFMKFSAVLDFVYSPECRQKVLLRYFGEEGQDCGRCDNCRRKPKTSDASEEVMKFLSCVWRYYKKFGHNPRISDVIRILRGESGKAAADPAWKTLSTWKIGEDFSQRDWEGIVRRLFVLGLLGLEESAEKRCCLTDKALSFLKNPEPVLIRARQKP